MIGFIPLQGTTAIKGKFACAPSTDMRNTDAVAVCFMLRNVLDAVLSPHLNLLLFGRCLLTLEVQVLENNYISRIENRKFYNGRGNLLDNSSLMRLAYAQNYVSRENRAVFETS